MKSTALLSFIAISVILVGPARPAAAGPIIKPRKYFGPIPAGSITFRVGFLGNATNREMIDFLDAGRSSAERAISNDFSNAISYDVTYMYKPHPQFGVRVSSSLTRLKSTGHGFFVFRPVGLPDSIPSPIFDYNRKFRVDLITMELSGVYFFSNAAVKEFQPYLGGGFTIGIPHQSFEEFRTNRDTGERTSIMRNEWSAEAGVHGVFGAFYYITNRTAISAEATAQVLQSQFPLSAKDENGQPQDVRFVVDYTGFSLSLGVSRAF